MFHRSVLGVESHNLDLFLCGEERLHALYERHRSGHGAAVCEGESPRLASAARSAQVTAVFPLPEAGAANNNSTIAIPRNQKNGIIGHEQMKGTGRFPPADADLDHFRLDAPVLQRFYCLI